MISILPDFGSLCRNRAASILWHLPKDPGEVTLSANVFSSVSLISALRKCDLLCWSALFLLWPRVKIKGFPDIPQGSRVLIRETAKPVSFQDVVLYPCSHSVHTWIITELPDVDTTKLREHELPAYQTCLCCKNLQDYLSPVGYHQKTAN